MTRGLFSILMKKKDNYFQGSKIIKFRLGKYKSNKSQFKKLTMMLGRKSDYLPGLKKLLLNN